VCEVHNDDPADDAPGSIVAALADPRITLSQHQRNLGGTESFNYFFQPTNEPFYSILEDDNWWDPEFLSTMLLAAQEYPKVTVFWANMRVWREQDDGSFRDTGRLVHPSAPCDKLIKVNWGHREQMYGSLHSNGALLVRSTSGQRFTTPPVPFAVMESFRDRMFPYPLVFISKPLVNFSLTHHTARSDDWIHWVVFQAVLMASFVKHAGLSLEEIQQVWLSARVQVPPRTNSLLLASLVDPYSRILLRCARPSDWFRLFRSITRSPRIIWEVLGLRKEHPDWWSFLDSHTELRFRSLEFEADFRRHGFRFHPGDEFYTFPA